MMKNINEASILAFNRIVIYTQKIVKEGAANGLGFIYVLSSVCNKFGLSQNLVEYAAVRRYLSDDLTAEIIKKAVADGYQNKPFDKGSEINLFITNNLIP